MKMTDLFIELEYIISFSGNSSKIFVKFFKISITIWHTCDGATPNSSFPGAVFDDSCIRSHKSYLESRNIETSPEQLWKYRITKLFLWQVRLLFHMKVHYFLENWIKFGPYTHEVL